MGSVIVLDFFFELDSDRGFVFAENQRWANIFR